MALLRAKKRKKSRSYPQSLYRLFQMSYWLILWEKCQQFHWLIYAKFKSSCNDFRNASVDRYIYQHVSLDKFALIPHSWFTNVKKPRFETL